MPRSNSSSKRTTAPASADELRQKLSHVHSAADIEKLGGMKHIMSILHCDLQNGLPESEVAISREKYGVNRLPDRETRPFLSHLWEALEDDTLRILLVSAFFSIIFAIFFSKSKFVDSVQGIAIIAAAVIVSGVNSFQNWSKDREFKALAEIKEDYKVRVLRSGEWRFISVYEVVVGDVVRIGGGDRIPADGLLLSCSALEINQSMMTGESTGARKGVAPSALELAGAGGKKGGSDSSEGASVRMHSPEGASGGADCIIIGGCIVQQGEGVYTVTAVGTSSHIGQTVTVLTNEEVGNTPLQDALEELAGQIGKAGMVVGTLTFVVLTALWLAAMYTRSKQAMLTAGADGATLDTMLVLKDVGAQLLSWDTASTILHFFIVGLAIVVVAVPEGLPLAVTISLAFSMKRMMEDKNLVRTLQACETMGSATVIASDKTGTLTQNRMSVVSAWVLGKTVNAETLPQLKAMIDNEGATNRLARAIALNSTADLKVKPAAIEVLGNATEGALLLTLLRDLGEDYSQERANATELIARRPFDTRYKYMASIYAPEGIGRNDGPIIYVKGAPEVVLDMCATTQNPTGGLENISEEMRFNLQEQVAAMARRGLRTLAVAYKRVSYSTVAGKTPAEKRATLVKGIEGAAYTPSEDSSPTGVESELTLLGLFGLADPLREGVPQALDRCRQAGIRVMMVTGDHRETAAHIARECGILSPGLEVMEGPQFRQLTDEQRVDVCSRLAVLARSSPTDKHLLVTTLKEMGEVVAVTGDGTNDAPALRAADVGLAMGIAGTEVAKEASDIVILDDRFSSIVASVRWGRSIKENIRKFLTFQLTINMVALTLTFVTACANGGDTETNFPITAVQLLWINLIMDSFAALALATEPPSEKLMEYAPQGKDEPLITRTMMKNMIGHAVFQAALLLACTMSPEWRDRVFELAPDSKYPNTAVFTTFVALQVFNLFNCRAVHDEWNVLAGFSHSVIAQVIIVLICVMQVVLVQFGGDFFQTMPLTLNQWLRCTLIGFASVPVGYLLKIIPAADQELRNLAPHSQRAPHGLLFAENDRVRDSVLRTLTEPVSRVNGPQSKIVQQANVIVAEAAAEDHLEEHPTKKEVHRRPKTKAAEPELPSDLDFLVATGSSKRELDGMEKRKRRASSAGRKKSNGKSE